MRLKSTHTCRSCKRTLPRESFPPRMRVGRDGTLGPRGLDDRCHECRHRIAEYKSTPPYSIDPNTGCWNWNKGLNVHGYAKITIWADGASKTYPGHRLYYERHKGPIPVGLELDHTCRNRRCVNPDHLEPVTGVENVRRAVSTILTVERVREMRRLYGTLSVPQLAKRYGIAKSTVYAVLSRQRWKDV